MGDARAGGSAPSHERMHTRGLFELMVWGCVVARPHTNGDAHMRIHTHQNINSNRKPTPRNRYLEHIVTHRYITHRYSPYSPSTTATLKTSLHIVTHPQPAQPHPCRPLSLSYLHDLGQIHLLVAHGASSLSFDQRNELGEAGVRRSAGG